MFCQVWSFSVFLWACAGGRGGGGGGRGGGGERKVGGGGRGGGGGEGRGGEEGEGESLDGRVLDASGWNFPALEVFPAIFL